MTAAGRFLVGGVLPNEQGAHNPHGAHGAPELVGAWVGSVLGATLVPADRGIWRVAHRCEL